MINNPVKGTLPDALLKYDQNRLKESIGEYKEKSLHNILKYYFEPNSDFHEIKIGKMVADIKNEYGIIEIQTRGFNKLRKKLDAFLKENIVTIVYPYASIKWLSWMDVNTGEISKKRKSPQKLSIFDSFYELYKISDYLSNPNLRLYLLGLEIYEIRLNNGWSIDGKKGSTRFDRYPLSIVEKTYIKNINDYAWLIPNNLPSPFTISEYVNSANISSRLGSPAMKCLTNAGILEYIGKEGRKNLYDIKGC
ncbi:MAG: hypothetical protein IJC89_01105 [Clostridia bacterium]|nr:hypothetical protein [Clostridia bacterium]